MRIVRIAVAAAAAAAFVLPATAAQAYCISIITTPVDCLKEAVNEAVAVGDVPNCVYYGTFELVCVSAN